MGKINTLWQRVLSTQDQYLVMGLWMASTIMWIGVYGLNTQLEAEKYLLQADYLLEHGKYSEARFLFYSGTIIINIISKILVNSPWLSFVMLWAINLFAYYKFYMAVKDYYNSKSAALLAICILLFYQPFQSWTTYLYSENLFFSLVLLLLSSLLQYKKISDTLVILLILALMLLTRPTAILFIPAIGIFLLIKYTSKQRLYLIIAAVVGLLIINQVAQIVFTTTSDWSAKRSVVEQALICDITEAERTDLDLNFEGNQLYGIFYYITHNFGNFISLAGKRLKLFFMPTRAYYSTVHNLFMIVTIGLLYLSLAWNFKYLRKNNFAILITGILMIVTVALSVAFQCDDYHSRFLMSVLPVLVLFAASILAETKDKSIGISA